MGLVGKATCGIYEDLRRENESLKRSLRQIGTVPNPTEEQILNPDAPKLPQAADFVDKASQRDEIPPSLKHGSEHNCTVGSECPILKKISCSPPTTQIRTCALENGWTEEQSRVPVCVVKIESIDQPCQDHRHQQTPTPPCFDDKLTVTQMILKEEDREVESNAPACSWDSMKVEDLSPECMSAIQSTLLDEWNPRVEDIHDQDEEDYLPNREASQHDCGISANSQEDNTSSCTCKSCNQSFQLPSELQLHSAHCQQTLQQVSAGRKRTKLHLYPPGCSPFHCPVCKREFNRKEDLKTHLRIHTGERPYTCSVCSKCFRHSGALTRHFRIHSGEKPYICGQCGKSFRNGGGLKVHQRSHNS
ncbi:zinc finger protein 271-like [Phyllopteryx taeniolatus]|uniref:zinc finger protein 271-like n=1 Tax=Phyllopteryx taeniolatus TaxID=161469 RepID=UPI002AD3308C|nr:zinc finger protein 271-like [Phyllopteryx taeniolatus]